MVYLTLTRVQGGVGGLQLCFTKARSTGSALLVPGCLVAMGTCTLRFHHSKAAVLFLFIYLFWRQRDQALGLPPAPQHLSCGAGVQSEAACMSRHAPYLVSTPSGSPCLWI